MDVTIKTKSSLISAITIKANSALVSRIAIALVVGVSIKTKRLLISPVNNQK